MLSFPSYWGSWNLLVPYQLISNHIRLKEFLSRTVKEGDRASTLLLITVRVSPALVVGGLDVYLLTPAGCKAAGYLSGFD